MKRGSKKANSCFNLAINNLYPRSKRAQVTMFIVVAIIIVIIVVIYFLVKNPNILPQSEKVNPQVEPIYGYVQSCLKETGDQAVFYTSFRGGYYNPPNNNHNGIAIYFDKGTNYFPSINAIEDEISLFMDGILATCIDDFKQFPDFEIKAEQSHTKTTIEPNKINFKVTMPLSISKGNKSYTLEYFSVEIPAQLYKVHSVISELMQDQIKNPDTMCLSCMYKLASENDLYFETNDIDSETVLFTIIDENSKVLNNSHIFNFVNKYKLKENE
ncbi:MAG: hypothetical protein ABIH37_01905 [archaeon]